MRLTSLINIPIKYKQQQNNLCHSIVINWLIDNEFTYKLTNEIRIT